MVAHHTDFGWKTRRKRPLGRPRSRWEDVKMDLRETGFGSKNRTYVAPDMDQWRALVNTVINLRVLSSSTTGGF
jgi:hypothetical protein